MLVHLMAKGRDRGGGRCQEGGGQRGGQRVGGSTAKADPVGAVVREVVAAGRASGHQHAGAAAFAQAAKQLAGCSSRGRRVFRVQDSGLGSGCWGLRQAVVGVAACACVRQRQAGVQGSGCIFPADCNMGNMGSSSEVRKPNTLRCHSTGP